MYRIAGVDSRSLPVAAMLNKTLPSGLCVRTGGYGLPRRLKFKQRSVVLHFFLGEI